MARDAEKVIDETERLSLFLPIKVVNGFVTCDFMLGCYCCKFCLNRRYPDWNALLEKNRVYRNPLDVAQAAALLSRTKAFKKAKVTLKIGHDTDMSLEETEAQQLAGMVPPEHPVIFMRRGKLLPQFRPFYMQPRKNLLVKVTLTPRSNYLEAANDPFEILDSFRGVRTAMFFAVGPICHDNADEAKELIRCLPPQSRMWVKSLIARDLPRFNGQPSITDEKAEELRRFASSQGHHVFDYLNCTVRAEAGLGFHKRGEFVSEHNAWELGKCRECKTLAICDVQLSEREERKCIDSALGDIGVTLREKPDKTGYKTYRVTADQDVNFGDECYVRELTGLKIDLESPGRKTGTSLTDSIVERWRIFDFFPVDELMGLAKESYCLAFGKKLP
jgi:hypothetical protein